MQIVVNNFHGDDLSWLPDGDVFIYDKKDKNVGSNIYDYMSWIVDNYDKLNDLVLFTKGNMLKRHITPEEWEKIRDNKTLTPLMTMNHKTDGVISYYKDGLYWEKNNQWYRYEHPTQNFEALIDLLGVRNKDCLGFSPGACWIVPRENILKQTKEMYTKLMSFIDYDANPAEAHLIERSLFYLWS
jgi:hypothetical protein